MGHLGSDWVLIGEHLVAIRAKCVQCLLDRDSRHADWSSRGLMHGARLG
jgi:hypothetical protein